MSLHDNLDAVGCQCGCGSNRDCGGGQGGEAKYSDDGGDSNCQQSRKLFVGGLSQETTEASLRAHFEQWGKIIDCVVVRDAKTRRTRGFGFITYEDASSFHDAQANIPHNIDSKDVEIKPAVPEGVISKTKSDSIGASNHDSVKKIFIGRLQDGTTEEQVREYFASFGTIEHVNILVDKRTGKPRGFAFVTFKDCDSVDKAVSLKFHEINTQKVEAKKAVPKDQINGASTTGHTVRGYEAGQQWAGNGGCGCHHCCCCCHHLASGGWGAASAGGFGSNHRGYRGGGQLKRGGYSAPAQGPYGGGWGAASAGGFGSNHRGYCGGGPLKHGYSAPAQGPYGGACGRTSSYGNWGNGYRRY